MNNTKKKPYNQTCHINSDKISSVIKLACCAADTSGGTTSSSMAPSTTYVTTSEGRGRQNKQENYLEGLTIVSSVKHPTTISNNEQQQQQPQQYLQQKLSGNLWSEKSKQHNHDSYNDHNDRRKSSFTPMTKQKNNISPTELMGIVPCFGSSDRVNGTSARRQKPFASNPIRADSLMEQSSLLSLYDSETMDYEQDGKVGLQQLQQMQQYHPTISSSSSMGKLSNATPTTPTPKQQQGDVEYNTPRRLVQTPTSLQSTQSQHLTPPPDSPAMELSIAKQSANRTQHASFRRNNRETLRYGSLESIPSSPTKKARSSDENDKRVISKTATAATDEDVSIATTSLAASSKVRNGTPTPPTKTKKADSAIMIIESHLEYINAPQPPLWTTNDGEEIDSELLSTYQYPRLYLCNPSQIINNSGSTNNWWYQLGQRMETTLNHVQNGHWKKLQQQYQYQSSNYGYASYESISAETSSSVHPYNSSHHLSNFGVCNMRTLESDSEEGCVALTRDLCIGQQIQQQNNNNNNNNNKHHRKNKSWSSVGSKSKSSTTTSKKSGKGRGRQSTSVFQPTSCPRNVWSEPIASTMQVRGPTYSTDGIKVDSDISLFHVIGVDSFVYGDDSGGSSASLGTRNFLKRWQNACLEVGINRPPFL